MQLSLSMSSPQVFEHQIGAGLGQLAASLAFGAVCGAVCGLALIWLLKHPSIVPDEFANIVTLGTVLVSIHRCEPSFS